MKQATKSIKNCKILLVSLCLVLTAGFSLSAQANDDGAVSVRLGGGNHHQRGELAWESPSLWSHRFAGNGSRLDLVGEIGAAYWHATGSSSPSSLWQLSAIPMLRWTFANSVYLEAGVGPTLIHRTRFGGKRLSTAFQFGDHIGVGTYLSSTSRIGVRYSHFSNADIKRPNPGLNLVQLVYTYQY